MVRGRNGSVHVRTPIGDNLEAKLLVHSYERSARSNSRLYPSQPDAEGRSLALLALYLDPAAIGLHDAVD